ncbi:MAG: hypothetical protein JNL70_16950 [Saprospiraceae bacterium]|nr:hypothetical protein [Saprospiraceae bacterium]
MYYIIRNDLKIAGATDINIPQVWENHSIISGKKIKKGLPPIEFTVKYKSTMPDFIPNIWRYIVLNEKAINAILSVCSAEDVEFHPCLLKNTVTKSINKNYFIANILNFEDVIDLGKSQIEYTDVENIIGVEKVIINSNIVNHNIFRTKNFIPLECCTQELMDKINSLNLNGIYFKPLEEYTL